LRLGFNFADRVGLGLRHRQQGGEYQGGADNESFSAHEYFMIYG
jgi:hypothetical protein